ncbi:MAG TPA: hypothetical protein VG298_14385 [Acidimicrobiales bacterium]|jgi:hypothetical protein|nr:hypothetical protein [Acidimicrobiales bacterium]
MVTTPGVGQSVSFAVQAGRWAPLPSKKMIEKLSGFSMHMGAVERMIFNALSAMRIAVAWCPFALTVTG